jgi:hypothetical protein
MTCTSTQPLSCRRMCTLTLPVNGAAMILNPDPTRSTPCPPLVQRNQLKAKNDNRLTGSCQRHCHCLPSPPPVTLISTAASYIIHSRLLPGVLQCEGCFSPLFYHSRHSRMSANPLRSRSGTEHRFPYSLRSFFDVGQLICDFLDTSRAKHYEKAILTFPRSPSRLRLPWIG